MTLQSGTWRHSNKGAQQTCRVSVSYVHLISKLQTLVAAAGAQTIHMGVLEVSV